MSLVIEDWQPKTMHVHHGTGTTGGCYTNESAARPPGGTYRVTFQGPNQLVMQSLTMGGSVTWYRAR